MGRMRPFTFILQCHAICLQSTYAVNIGLRFIEQHFIINVFVIVELYVDYGKETSVPKQKKFTIKCFPNMQLINIPVL